MAKEIIVLAECIDSRNGKRFFRGDVFKPAPTPEQADRLIKAACLPEYARELAAETPVPEEEEDEMVDLSKLTIEALKALAAERNVDLGDATKKADIIAAIELAAEPK